MANRLSWGRFWSPDSASLPAGRPQFLTGATTGDQARIVSDNAREIMQAAPSLMRAFKIEVYSDYAVNERSRGVLKYITNTGKKQDGLHPTIYVLDELHAHDTRRLFDVLASARGKSRFSMGIYITTAGYNTNGICYAVRLRAQKVLAGTLPLERMFAFIATLDEANHASFKTQKYWRQANPSLKHMPMLLETMKGEIAACRGDRQAEAEFKTKRCNIWLDGFASWLGTIQWDALADGKPVHDDFAGQRCWVGVDMADRDDLAAVAVVVQRAGAPRRTVSQNSICRMTICPSGASPG